MLSLEEQVARKCIHFNGVMNKTCNVGIKYADVRDNSRKPYGFPCIQTGGRCDHAKFRTSEEVVSYLKEMLGEGAKAIVANFKIKDHYAKTNHNSGKIPCECGGELNYVIAKNGHVHAKCKSCGISFME